MNIVWFNDSEGKIKESIYRYVKQKDAHAFDKTNNVAIAEIGENVVGLIIIKIKNHVRYLDHVEVEPAFRNRGIATQLVKESVLRLQLLYVEFIYTPSLNAFFNRFAITSLKNDQNLIRLLIHPSSQKL